MGAPKDQRRIWLALLAIPLVLQSCQKSPYYSSLQGAASSNPSSVELNDSGGNGHPFEGHPALYFVHYDATSPCVLKGADGMPLPNREIAVSTGLGGRSAQLVREACADLNPPVALNVAALNFSTDGSGTLIYQNVTFVPQIEASDFDVIAPSCPAGLSAKAGATRVDLIVDSQNLTSANWADGPGLAVQQEGSLAGLPGYLVSRNDASLLDIWRRLQQNVPLTPSKTYAFTFYAEPGTSSMALAAFWDANTQSMLDVYFDLITGATGSYYNTGMTGVSLTARAFGNGMICTAYFTAPAGAGLNAMGVAPLTSTALSSGYGEVGDSIHVTAMELEDVEGFCQ